MKFHWVAGITLWTVLSGPAMYGGPPAPASRQPSMRPQQEHKFPQKQLKERSLPERVTPQPT
jgi:hypothetical protein